MIWYRNLYRFGPIVKLFRLRFVNFSVRLEDPEAEEVKDFVEKQVNLSDSLLKTCETKEKLHEKITKLIDHPRYDTPFKRGNSYFYFHNTGLQAQSVLYIQVTRNMFSTLV